MEGFIVDEGCSKRLLIFIFIGNLLNFDFLNWNMCMFKGNNKST